MDAAPLSWVRNLRVTFILIGLALALCFAATVVVYFIQDSNSNGNKHDAATLRLAAIANAESTNRMVCVTRPYIRQALNRAIASRDDEHQSDAVRERARQSVESNSVFLGGLVTVPPTFNCKPLIAKIRREAARSKPN